MTSTPPFSVRGTRTGRTAVLMLAGELDLQSEAPWIAEISHQCTTDAATIVIDMAEVTFIDSSGLRLLINGKKIADDAGASIRLTRVPEPVIRLLDMTGLSDEFEVEPLAD